MIGGEEVKAYLSDLVLEKVWRRQWVDSSY